MNAYEPCKKCGEYHSCTEIIDQQADQIKTQGIALKAYAERIEKLEKAHPVKQLSDEEIKKIIMHLRFIKQLLTCHGDLGGATEIDKEIRGNIEIVMINDEWIKALKEITE
jgi:hypothetical protein